MPATATPFLMFQGQAEAAMGFWCGLVENSAIEKIERWGPDGPGEEGTVFHAVLRLAGQQFRVIDSPPVHDFGFTPAFSIFLEVESGAEVDRLAGALGEGGNVLMPADRYDFAKRFAWVQDRFGVSWQISHSG